MIQVIILLGLVITSTLSSSLLVLNSLLSNSRQETEALVRLNHEAAITHCIQVAVSNKGLSCWSKEALPTAENLIAMRPFCQVECHKERIEFTLFRLSDTKQIQCIYREKGDEIFTIWGSNQFSVGFILRKSNLKL